MTLRIVPAGAIVPGIHHTFGESTLAGVVGTLNTMSEAAHAQFAMEVTYKLTNNRLSDIELTVTLTIDMPEWTNVAQRPAAEQNEWNRFLRALRVHEDGHIRIFRRESPRAHSRALRARHNTIDAVVEAERARIVRLSDAYDTRTGHGTTQRTPHGTTVITLPP